MNDFFAAEDTFDEIDGELALDEDAWIAKMLG